LGIGTAYRHFENKQQLAEALFSKAIAEIVADAEQALTIADPWQAFVAFFTAAAERQAKDRGLFQALVGRYRLEDCVDIREQLDEPVSRLYDQAIAAGVLRPEAVPTDTGVIFSMLGVVYEMSSASSPELWRRYLALILDGLRASAADPLPVQALTQEELQSAIADQKSRLRGC
jgi:AcrR family transcriptional regulator